MSYHTLLNNIYASSTHNLSIDILKSERYELNCFIKSEKLGNYPPRMNFDRYLSSHAVDMIPMYIKVQK